MKKYKVYGLNVMSEMELCYSKASFESADVTIVFGKMPDQLKYTIEETKRYVYNKSQLIYKVKNIANFLIEEGSKITIDPINDCPHKTIKLYLDGIAFSCILAQRGIPAYHGSAVKIDGKCLLIMGSSGAGKSSLTTGLLDYGCEFISDDIIVFAYKDNQLMVHPGFPEQKLSSDLIKNYKLENIVDQEVYYPGVKKDKYFINRTDTFYNKPCQVDAIVYLRISEKEFSIRQVRGIEKLDVVLKNTFRSSFINIFNKEKEQFKISAALANRAATYIIKRPYDKYTINEQVKVLTDLLKEIK